MLSKDFPYSSMRTPHALGVPVLLHESPLASCASRTISCRQKLAEHEKDGKCCFTSRSSQLLPTLLQSVDLISVKLPCDGNVNGALRGLAWLGGVPSHPLDDIAAGDRGAVKGRIHGALLQAHHEGEHWAASHGAKLLDDR